MSVIDEKWHVRTERRPQWLSVMLTRGDDDFAHFGRPEGFFGGAIVDAQPGDEQRAELAAMAPEMAREMLALEWRKNTGICSGGCDGGKSWGHTPGCILGALCDRLRKLAATSG